MSGLRYRLARAQGNADAQARLLGRFSLGGPATPFPVSDYDLAFEGPSATVSSWVASTGGVTLNQSGTPTPVIGQSTSPVTNLGPLADSAVQFSGGYYSGGPYTLPEDANGKTTVRVLFKSEPVTSGDATIFSWARQRGGAGAEKYIEPRLRGTSSIFFNTFAQDSSDSSQVSLNRFVNGGGGWQLADIAIDRANGEVTYYVNGGEFDPGSESAFDFGSTEEGYLWIGARPNVSGQLTSATGATAQPLLNDQRVLFLGFRAGGITLNQHRNDAEKLGLWSP